MDSCFSFVTHHGEGKRCDLRVGEPTLPQECRVEPAPHTRAEGKNAEGEQRKHNVKKQQSQEICKASLSEQKNARREAMKAEEIAKSNSLLPESALVDDEFGVRLHVTPNYAPKALVRRPLVIILIKKIAFDHRPVLHVVGQQFRKHFVLPGRREAKFKERCCS